MSSKSLVSLLVVLMAASAFANLSCLNRQGSPTAWFNAIRYPNTVTASGARYAYLDPSAGSAFQIVSGANCDDASEPLAKTIESINSFSGSNKNLLVYTNTPSNGTLIGNNAHAKAIIAFDSLTNTGIYIMFSFLSYPDVAQDGTINYTIPLDGNEYAQMNGPDGNYVYCLSFDSDLLSVLKDFLPNAQPNIVYSSGIFSNMPTNPNFVYEISPFTVPNADFQWFVTKSSTANMNMYDDIIANQFGVNLAVASSQNLTNACAPMIVLNIDSITLNTQDTWSSADDNSKWAVGILGTLEAVFFCDNDRTPEQNNRGGSCIATADRNVYAAYQNIFAYNNSCGNTTMILDNILA